MRERHLHELLYRTKDRDGNVYFTRFAAQNSSDTDVREDWVDLCEAIAKDGTTLVMNRDAIVYRVDGMCEFLVSRYFYLWPNTFDREDRHGKSSGKGQQRRNQFSRGRAGG